MKKWIVSACILSLTATPVAAADVRLDFYRNPPKESMRGFSHAYLDGVKTGLLISNWRLKHLGSQPLFCTPDDLVISTEQAEEIMLKAAEKRNAKGDALVAVLLQWGMQDTFPCPKPGGP